MEIWVVRGPPKRTISVARVRVPRLRAKMYERERGCLQVSKSHTDGVEGNLFQRTRRSSLKPVPASTVPVRFVPPGPRRLGPGFGFREAALELPGAGDVVDGA